MLFNKIIKMLPQLGLGLQSPTSPRPTMRWGRCHYCSKLHFHPCKFSYFPRNWKKFLSPTDTVSDFESLRSLLHTKTPPVSSQLLSSSPRKHPIPPPAQAAEIWTPVVGKRQALSTFIPFHATPKNCPPAPLIPCTLRLRSLESTMGRRVNVLRRTLRRSRGAREVGSHT